MACCRRRHPQGCTVGYAMLAALPAMNDKISVVIHMGPVVFIEWFRAPFLRAMSSGSAYEVSEARTASTACAAAQAA